MYQHWIQKFPSLVGTRSVSYFPCKVRIPRLWDVNMAFVHHILLGCTFCCTSWIITASYGFVHWDFTCARAARVKLHAFCAFHTGKPNIMGI
jgi:hypothetical protein